MVEVKNITKRYGKTTVVDDISFTANSGEILGFLGPNGAGKSTTMNIITGYISSTSGTVTVDGNDILSNPRKVKSLIGYLPEIPPLYVDMTVKKYLEFMFDLKRVKLPKIEHIEEVMRLVKIDHVSDRLIKQLSKGYRQRVGFAQALLGNPPVLIFDEPTVGLDPQQIIEIRSIIRSLGKKHTVIFSSHVLSEVAEICDRIIVISNGKIVKDTKTRDLAKSVSSEQKLSLVVEGSANAVLDTLKVIPHVKKIRKKADSTGSSARYIVEYDVDADIRRDVFRALSSKGFVILGMESADETLEDSFLKLVSQDQTKEVK